MAVYLLHFDRKFHHAAHYVGFTTNLQKRLEEHRKGRTSRLMKAIHDEGILFQVAMVWEHANGNFERRLKNTNSSKDYCPICMGEKVHKFEPRPDELSEPVRKPAGKPAQEIVPERVADWLPY